MRYHNYIREMTKSERLRAQEREAMNKLYNKDYLVTVKVTCFRKYIVNAKDWEYAEDYACDEALGDTFRGTDDDVQIESYEVRTI